MTLERMPKAEGPAERFTLADHWDYTNAELRGVAASTTSR